MMPHRSYNSYNHCQSIETFTNDEEKEEQGEEQEEEKEDSNNKSNAIEVWKDRMTHVLLDTSNQGINSERMDNTNADKSSRARE